jgi:hypothetical protein
MEQWIVVEIELTEIASKVGFNSWGDQSIMVP